MWTPVYPIIFLPHKYVNTSIFWIVKKDTIIRKLSVPILNL